MSVADSKAALDACQNGIDLMTAQQKSNQTLVNDYNLRHKAWEARRNTADNTWNQANTNRQNDQRSWDNKFSEHKSAHLNDEIWTDCNTNSCPADYSKYLDHSYCWNDGINKYKQKCGISDQHAIYLATKEVGNRPPDYNTPKFSEGEPSPSQQNTTPINISCCANVLNVVASDVTQTNINQQNDCLSSKTQALANAKAKVTSDAKALSDADANTKAKVISDAKAVSDANKRKIVMIIVIIICFMIAIIGLIINLS